MQAAHHIAGALASRRGLRAEVFVQFASGTMNVIAAGSRLFKQRPERLRGP
jgi:hypothetical protein